MTGAGRGGSARASAAIRQPASVRLPVAIRDAVVDHALAERPNEACGVILGDAPADDGGRPLRFAPARNALASPYRFDVHPDDLLALALAADAAGEAFWAIVHSHVASEAVPSPTDVAHAAYPEALHLIVSLRRCPPLAGGDAEVGHEVRLLAELGLWRIAEGVVTSLALEIVP